MAQTLGLLVLLASVGCASRYAYTFQLTDPGAHHATSAGESDAIEDADLKAEILVDPTADALVLDLTNKTDQVLQIDWAKIAIARPSGNTTTLRPDVDLGWLLPGAHTAAKLFPIALPRSGRAAVANEGRAFRLSVPAIVRREVRVYHFTLVAHVREL
jgi:hypothetical protein